MKYIVTALAVAAIFSGCSFKDGNLVGDKTGINYTKVYKVIKGGVPVFMTEDEIEKAGLDKASEMVESGYEVIKTKEGNETAE